MPASPATAQDYFVSKNVRKLIGNLSPDIHTMHRRVQWIERVYRVLYNARLWFIVMLQRWAHSYSGRH